MGEQADLEIDNAMLHDDSWMLEDDEERERKCVICGELMSDCGHDSLFDD
jgi:hypothetical protein